MLMMMLIIMLLMMMIMMMLMMMSQTDRQTDRQTDGQTDRHTYKIHTRMLTWIHKDVQANEHTCTCTIHMYLSYFRYFCISFAITKNNSS